LRYDNEIALAALCQNIDALKSVPIDLWSDKEFVLGAWIYFKKRHVDLSMHIAPTLREDEEFMTRLETEWNKVPK
jgi:hypothetical protein